MKELKIRLMERMLSAELTAHLGYDAGAAPPAEQTNRRNGGASKRVKGQDGEMPLTVPRDRDGSFEPELVKKGQTRVDGPGLTGPTTSRRIRKQSGGLFSRRGIGLYAHGLTVRDIQAHLEDLYGLKVSPDLISRVTDAVLDEVREWQSRALERMYPIRRRENDPPDRFLVLLHLRWSPLLRHWFKHNGERGLRGLGRHQGGSGFDGNNSIGKRVRAKREAAISATS